MRRRTITALAAAVVAELTVATGATTVAATPAEAAPLGKVLVFSKTAGFRHSSIPNGIAAIQQLGAANGFTVTATEDAATFTTANLAQYQAVVFLSTTGDVLNAGQQGAFEAYMAGGGGFVGVHAASDTEYDWPWYGGLVGAYFASHPAIQQATVRVEDRANASTAHLPSTWPRTDEWYNYRANPAPRSRCWPASTSRRTRVGQWVATTRSPGATATAADAPGTPASATPSRATATRTSPGCCSAASRWRPGQWRPTAGRSPATPRCSTARRPASGSGARPGRAASPWPTAPSRRTVAWGCSGTPYAPSATTRSRSTG
ncbi:hypothetical protein GCM10027614_79930 [Micromonospora vulcania]